jgi:peptide/nickel transport system substrate-binding protein
VTETPKIVDEYTIDLVTAKPTPILPTYLAWLSMTSPNTPMDKQVLYPVGTGPYMIDKFLPGQEIDAKRNDKWWGPKPQVEAVKYIWRVESSVRAAMVKVGEADLASEIAQQEVRPPEASFRDVSYPNAETAHLRIETTFPPLDDRRVRVALNVAVDRESLKGSIFPKEVALATNIVVPGVSGYNPNIKPWPFDPAQAKKLLAEAKAGGVPVDKEILLVGRTNLYPNSTESMEALAAMWKAVGFNTKISMLEVGNWQKWNVKPFPENRGPNLLQTRHNNQSGDLEFSAFSQWACDGSRSGICDKTLDAMIAQATGLTGDARVKAWQEVARTIYEDKVTNVFLFHLIGFARIGSRINYEPDFLTTGAIDVASITFR